MYSERFSLHYDSLMGDYTMISNLLIKLVLEYVSNGSQILELGCGTGNMLTALKSLKKNYSLSGVDISPAMIERSRAKLPTTPLYVADMATFMSLEKVDCVICVFDSINHVTRLSLWRTLFSNTHKNLKKNGVFIFDMNTLKRMEYLSNMPPYVKKLNKDTLACIKVTKLKKNIFRGNYQFFSHIRQESVQYLEENVDEGAFEIEKVRQHLEKYFIVKKVVDPIRKRVSKNTGRVFFVCIAK